MTKTALKQEKYIVPFGLQVAAQDYIDYIRNINKIMDVANFPKLTEKIGDCAKKELTYTVKILFKLVNGLHMTEWEGYQDAVSAGMTGICNAINKYDISINDTRNAINAYLKDLPGELTAPDFAKFMSDFKLYGPALKAFNKLTDESGWAQFNKDKIESWANKFLKPAKFSSVAYFWIMCEIHNFIIKGSLRSVQYDSLSDYEENGTEIVGTDSAETLCKNTDELKSVGTFLRNIIYAAGLDRPEVTYDVVIAKISDGDYKTITKKYGFTVNEVNNIYQKFSDKIRSMYSISDLKSLYKKISY